MQIMIDLIDDNGLVDEKEKLKTFSIHETDLSMVKFIKNYLFQYKHLENILNLLLREQFEFNQSLTNDALIEGKKTFNLLFNDKIMKAVLVGNAGGIATKDNIAFINNYFQNNPLFIQAKLVCKPLNDKNISMVVRRIKKDWSNYFSALKTYSKNPSAFKGKPSYPKAKKLSKVFNYSLPLEPDKWSLKRKNEKLLGINLGKKMFNVYIGKSLYFKDKTVNNVTVSYSHGHIYYNFTYSNKKQDLPKSNKELVLPKDKVRKEAGGDIGLNNLLSLFINDENTKSLTFSGKEVISYNCNFNKRLSEINTLISYEVKSYKDITDKNGKITQVPESYTNKGKSLIKRKSQLFERRKLFFYDYMNKVSKKVVEYLSAAKVTDLVLSKNLSFTKVDGSIQMQKKTKQKFYQIPFGNMLNLISGKAEEKSINVVWIDEAYTSKTSSISAEVVEVQKLSKIDKNQIVPNDLNGNRGTKKKGVLNNKLGRGLFKDSVINKVLNADINAACNHIKVAFKHVDKKYLSKYSLNKWCNPVKIKSNHEFDILLKQIGKNQIVDIQNGSVFYLKSVA
jgi:putative transposase